MGLHETARPCACRRRGPGMPVGQPAHTMRNELGSLQGHECAHRVAHHLTLTIAGGFAGVEIVRLDTPPSNRTCA